VHIVWGERAHPVTEQPALDVILLELSGQKAVGAEKDLPGQSHDQRWNHQLTIAAALHTSAHGG
jgi:hypothetical protein